MIPRGVHFLAASRWAFYARDSFFRCFWLIMVSKKTPSSTGAPAPPQPAALPLDSMPTVSARSPQSLDDEATLVYGSTKGAAGRLQIEEGAHAGEEVLLSTEPCVIGRSSECALVLRRSAGISRKHAQVQLASGTFYLEDLGSRNGTKLNGTRISERTPLRDGDVIGISSEQIRFIGPPMVQADPEIGAAALQNASDQKTALVEQPDLQALLAASARPDREDVESDDGFSPATRRPKDTVDQVAPREPAVERPPALSADFGPGVHTTTDAPSAGKKKSLAAVDAEPAQAYVEPTTRRAPPMAPPKAAQKNHERSFETPPQPSKSIALPISLIVALLLIGGVAYDFGLNDGALFESILGDSSAPPPAAAAESNAVAPATRDEDAVASTTPPAEPTAAPPEAATVAVPALEKSPVSTSSAPTTSNAPAPPNDPTPTQAAPLPAAQAEQKVEVPAPPVSTSTPRGATVRIKSPMTGVVAGITVRVGSKITADQVLMQVSHLPTMQSRKKRALMREEKLFAPLAAKGDGRAAKDLAAVRKELREVEGSRQRKAVRAPASGIVREILVQPGQSIGAGVHVITVEAD